MGNEAATCHTNNWNSASCPTSIKSRTVWSYGPSQQSSVPNHSQPLPGYPIDLNTSATRVLNGLGARPPLVISGALDHMLFSRMSQLVS